MTDPRDEQDPGPPDESALIEEAAGAWRPADPRQVAVLPAWHDLSPEARLAAHQLATELRRIEAALDPRGQSGTVRAVLRRIAAG